MNKTFKAEAKANLETIPMFSLSKAIKKYRWLGPHSHVKKKLLGFATPTKPSKAEINRTKTTFK